MLWAREEEKDLGEPVLKCDGEFLEKDQPKTRLTDEEVDESVLHCNKE